MYLKEKWNNQGVRTKIFISSITLIILGFSILYLVLYTFMPKVYEKYKHSTLEKKINSFVSDLEENRYSNIDEVLDNFIYENNLMVTIKDSSGKLLYSSFRQGFIKPTLPIKGENNKADFNNFNYEKTFNFYQLGEECTISIHSALRAASEMKNTIKVFFPFAVLTIITLASTISYIYSKLISKPLIEISKKAKKISELDFSEKLYPKGKDEISDLSLSLNRLSYNLNETINELEEANSKLMEDIERDRKIEKERREFIATVSHELKSPLTIISGQLEGMIYNIGKYKDRDKYLGESYEVTRKMETLVYELLDFSKRDKDEFKLNISEVNLSKLIREILRENYYFVEEKNINLQEDVCDNINLLGDKNLLKKAISNIIKNAIQYSPSGETVYVKLNNKGFTVKNTGVSIKEEDMKNIYKAFYRVEKSRNAKTGGTGLGLYIVKNILDKHNNIQYEIKSENNSVEFNFSFI